MSVTDPIADMITRIRNAMIRGHEKVDMPSSKIKTDIARVLKQEGYIKDYRIIQEDAFSILKIILKYDTANNKGVISKLKRVSRPGRRIYVGKDDIPKVLNGLGIAILSTPRGILTDTDARREKVGGEILCEVW